LKKTLKKNNWVAVKICILEVGIKLNSMSTNRKSLGKNCFGKEETLKQNEIVLFNDEVNYFDHVI